MPTKQELIDYLRSLQEREYKKNGYAGVTVWGLAIAMAALLTSLCSDAVAARTHWYTVNRLFAHGIIVTYWTAVFVHRVLGGWRGIDSEATLMKVPFDQPKRLGAGHLLFIYIAAVLAHNIWAVGPGIANVFLSATSAATLALYIMSWLVQKKSGEPTEVPAVSQKKRILIVTAGLLIPVFFVIWESSSLAAILNQMEFEEAVSSARIGALAIIATTLAGVLIGKMPGPELVRKYEELEAGLIFDKGSVEEVAERLRKQLYGK